MGSDAGLGLGISCLVLVRNPVMIVGAFDGTGGWSETSKAYAWLCTLCRGIRWDGPDAAGNPCTGRGL